MIEPQIVTIDDIGSIHMIGVGGSGMSGIAKLLAQRGVFVSGIDNRNGIPGISKFEIDRHPFDALCPNFDSAESLTIDRIETDKKKNKRQSNHHSP